MTESARYLLIAGVGALCAVVLQVFLAPHIALFSAAPNFLVAFALAMAVIFPSGSGPVLPFVLGLLFDLVSGGPVGALAFTLCAVSTFASWFFNRTGNDTVFMAIVVLAAAVLLVDLAYGMFMLLFGYAAGFLEALAFRIVPHFLYDLVIAVVAYLVASRLSGPSEPVRSEIRQLK